MLELNMTEMSEEDFCARIQEYVRRQWRKGFGINEENNICTHEESTKK